ncbi:hypothetical protein EW026_g4672 [Hermanssonia centrifuga]|uniref:RlpA-like protein double-psi beta-barrel domain-containing protein n=1 Tax=Hermanssonia centrifuga TaxID=98765 RepID=A0A4S4KKW8_9APHY|nr:hypothetical protein EW026_g4672 [Hermanssonia centrifuga]
MARFATILFALSTLLAATSATPVEENALVKRITHSGRGTYFDTGLGACGWTNQNSDKIIAISSSIFGSGGNCGQYIQITNTANGKVAYGTVADSCPGCGSTDLDMTPSLFEELGTLPQGVLQISWHYENKAFKLN